MSAPAQGTAGEIVMPRLSDTMEEGTILRWLKADGETVQRGEELVEIETDKATMVYESDVAGTLTLLAAEGATLAVGQPIARVAAGAGDGAAPGPPDARAAEPDAPAPQAPARAEAGDGPQGAPQAQPPAAPPAPNGAAAAQSSAAQAEGSARVKASPLARRIARLRGIDLSSVTGTGPGGRIVKADVAGDAGEPTLRGAPATGTGAAPPAAAAPPGPATPPGAESVATAKGETTEVELNRLQQAVARRMAESKATIPDFTISLDVDMEECVALRAELKRLAADGAGSAPTYNDMVVKACALGLREHPKANASYRDGKLLLHSRVNVGVAVAAEGALVVPTVFDADAKALGEIARETRALAARVREGTITPPELGGGTFTVSNLGMFGIRSFTPIINPPQAAILSVGALERRAAVGGDGGVKAVQMLTLTLVCDHRILFGAEAAQFLARVGELLRAPAALTL
jgi:pyruvate dehydrogenase E2 component (dihydrolipoamide acetyltransferase)